MKLTAILLLAACLQVSASTEGQTVTLSVKDVPMKQVFREIQKQTGLNVLVKESLLEKAGMVTLDVKNMPVDQVLTLCLKNQPLSYSIEGGVIVIKSVPAVTLSTGDKPATEGHEGPPPIDIKGRVTNENGEPVRATVTVKGTTIAVATNDNGEFEIKGVDENAILVITGINIETKEIKVAGKTDLTINVKIKISEGEEVIVKTNYWEVSQRKNPGNISKVDAKTIEKQPINNPLQALQGRVPGIYIQQNGGVPGGSFTVRIRGRNSIDNGNEPLYVIDGVPFSSESLSSTFTSGSILAGGQSPLNSLNVANIESIQVLKDADATAIYGSRGANGVVLITTKKGKPGKTKVDLNVYRGAGKVTRKINLLNTQQYLQMRNEAFTNDGLIPGLTDHDVNGTWDQTRYTDWQKVLIGGTAQTTNAQLSFSGGSANTQFSLGGGYYRENTVFPGDFSYQKASSHFSLVHTSSDQKFRAILSAIYVNERNNMLADDLTTDAMSLSPNAPTLYNADGKLNWENSTWINPLRNLEKKYEGKTNNLLSNVILSYKVANNLEIKSSFGFNSMQLNDKTFAPTSYFNPADGMTSENLTSRFNYTTNQSWIIEPQINWQTKLAKGKLAILIGSTFQGQVREQLVLQATGFSSNSLIRNIRAASMTTVDDYGYVEYRYNALYGRVNYDWQDKYILNLTARRDGSSRFGPGKQFANFGSAGIAWVFSRENFIQKIFPFLSYGKLRGSYGSTGNDRIADYGFLDTYSPSDDYNGITGLGPDRLFNPDFAWETNKKSELGIELGLINDRILFSVSYYRNRTSNQLVAYRLPQTTGFASIQANLPAIVQNKGLEIELNTENIKKKSFEWNTSFNITIPRNKLIAFPDLETSTYANSYAIGQPLNIRKIYHSLGVDPTTGLYKFEDVNGDGIISTPDDRQVIQFIGQRFYGGLNNSFLFKGVQLDILFQFVKQKASGLASSFGIPGSMRNQPEGILDSRWKNPNDETELQQFSTGQNSSASLAFDNYTNSDASIIDASFIRLKNVSLSYQLPERWIKRVKSRLYLQGQNLLTITNYNGLDPENQSGNFLPPLRVLTIGVQLIF